MWLDEIFVAGYNNQDKEGGGGGEATWNHRNLNTYL